MKIIRNGNYYEFEIFIWNPIVGETINAVATNGIYYNLKLLPDRN